MQYALIFYEMPAESARRNGPDAEDYWTSWTNYMAMMRERGAMKGGNALHPGKGTLVKHAADGSRIVEDGPYAESREELGGFVIVDVENLDAAITFASAAPCAQAGKGRVEVHPVLEMQSKPAEDAA
ncbi:MAG: YciI family protein [Pseudomonadota bacterium]